MDNSLTEYEANRRADIQAYNEIRSVEAQLRRNLEDNKNWLHADTARIISLAADKLEVFAEQILYPKPPESFSEETMDKFFAALASAGVGGQRAVAIAQRIESDNLIVREKNYLDGA